MGFLKLDNPFGSDNMDRGRDIVLAAIEQIECLAARQGDPQTRPITDTSDLRKILPAGGEKDLREKNRASTGCSQAGNPP